jgi:hypothetical protein
VSQIVAIHSQDDDVLVPLSDTWLKYFNEANLSLELVRLFGPDASRSLNASFGTKVSGSDVTLVTGLSHGTPDAFTGYGGEVLYGADSTVPQGELTGKIVHFLSCSTGARLGPFLAKYCKAFIGYINRVAIPSNPELMDALVNCDLQIDVALGRGQTVAQAVSKAKDAMIHGGLADQASALVFYPDDGQATLETTTRTLPESTLPNNTIGRYQLPSNWTIARRTLPTNLP